MDLNFGKDDDVILKHNKIITLDVLVLGLTGSGKTSVLSLLTSNLNYVDDESIKN